MKDWVFMLVEMDHVFHVGGNDEPKTFETTTEFCCSSFEFSQLHFVKGRLGSCWDDPLPSAVFFLPRGWRKGSQSYPLGCLNRSTRTTFFYGFFIWIKLRYGHLVGKVSGDFYPTKASYREESGFGMKTGIFLTRVNSSNLYHQIAFFCVDFFSNTVNKHCCGLFFFPCGKVGIPIGIHSWWNFHETFDHLGTDSPGKHPGAFKTIIAWQFCWWPFEGMVRFSDLQWLACDENLSGFSRCCIGLFIYLGSGPPP